MLLIVIVIAGLVFGLDVARGAIVAQLSGLMGAKAAEAMQELIRSASQPREGLWATLVGLIVIVVAASGVFGEVQAALNAIWKAKPCSSTVTRLVRARLASLGLVITFGFMLMVALSVALQALSMYLAGMFPAQEIALQAVDFVVSIGLMWGMFAAMYKVLPDTPVAWRDVAGRTRRHLAPASREASHSRAASHDNGAGPQRRRRHPQQLRAHDAEGDGGHAERTC